MEINLYGEHSVDTKIIKNDFDNFLLFPFVQMIKMSSVREITEDIFYHLK